jgi:ABC-2 type transport system permease protein
MTKLIRTEFLKLRTIRLPWGLLAGTAALTALITTLLASRTGHVGLGGEVIPRLSTADGVSRVITATRFGMLFATVLGITISSGEFRHGTATPTYLAAPQRARVMLAKIIAGTVAGAVFGAVAAGVGTGIGLAFVVGKGFAIPLATGTIVRYAMGSVLAAALFGAIGVALGSLIRNQVAGVVGVFAWGFVIENILVGVLPSVGRYLPYTLSISMAGRAQRGIEPLPFAVATAIIAGVAVVIAVVAARTTVQADIA